MEYSYIQVHMIDIIVLHNSIIHFMGPLLDVFRIDTSYFKIGRIYSSWSLAWVVQVFLLFLNF